MSYTSVYSARCADAVVGPGLDLRDRDFQDLPQAGLLEMRRQDDRRGCDGIGLLAESVAIDAQRQILLLRQLLFEDVQ
jgi:hypothetical protein